MKAPLLLCFPLCKIIWSSPGRTSHNSNETQGGAEPGFGSAPQKLRGTKSGWQCVLRAVPGSTGQILEGTGQATAWAAA